MKKSPIYNGEDNNILFNKYRIISAIGKGGYSHVWLAEHIRLKCLRAIKVIRKDNVLYERLLKEAYVLKKLNHECIPTIYDIEEDENCSYIIEEYCRGISLKKEKKLYKGFSESQIISYLTQICNLIEYLHNNGNRIIYLDMKPDNLLVEDGKVTLVDFGAAEFESDIDKMEFSMGTKGYAAPEQYSDKKPDLRSDIYGIGKIIQYMITDNEKCPLSENINKLRCVMKKCLMENPDERFDNVRQLREEIILCSRNTSGFIKNMVDTCSKITKKYVHCQKTLKKKPATIGVCATHRGAGATTLALSVSQYMNNYTGERSSIVELNDYPISKYVGDAVQMKVMIKTVKNAEELTEIKDNEKNNIIIDFGRLSIHNTKSFTECDIKVVVTNMCEWKIHFLHEFLQKYSGVNDFDEWIYVVPAISDKEKKLLKQYYGIDVWCVGNLEDVDKEAEGIKAFMTKVIYERIGRE